MSISKHPVELVFPPKPIIRRPPAEEIGEGIAISVYYGMKITPVDVARVLERAKVRYVLAGAHAVNAHTGVPRATMDVDFVTDAPKKATAALLAAYPHLTAQDSPVVTRLLDDGKEAVDVMKAGVSPLFRKVIRRAISIEIEGQQVVIPMVEGMLAMKFASMINPLRAVLDRQQDAVDFGRVVKAVDSIDDDQLRELGDAAYAGGGDELLQYVADAKADRPLSI